MNSLIFKNTIFLFVRMILIVVLSLLTVRFLLEKVGFEDYGIFILASSIIYLSSFITGALNTISTRYISNALIVGDDETKSIFSKLLNLTFLLFLILSLILFLIYVFFIPDYIVVKKSYMHIFKSIYIFSCLVFLIDCLKTPFNALLISLEKINVYAFFEIMTSLIRFSSIFLLGYISYNEIVSYVFLIFFFSLVLGLFYVYLCVKTTNYCEINIKNKDIRGLINVSLWDIYGNFCSLMRFQAVTILINNFFGSVVIAAVGISNQIQSMGMMLVSNLSTAMKPRIFKYYAENKYDELIIMINLLVKISTILLLLILIPYFLEYKFLLDFWLKSYPVQLEDISRLIMVFLIFSNLSMCAILCLHAAGDFKKPSVINGSLYLLIPAMTYFIYSNGGGYSAPFIINIIAVTIGGLLNLTYVKLKFKNSFSFYNFYIKSFLYTVVFGFFVFCFLFFVKSILPDGGGRFLAISILNLIIFMLYSYYFVLDAKLKLKLKLKLKEFV